MSLVVLSAFFVIVLLAVPVAHALVVATGVALLIDGNLPLNLVVTQMFQQTQSFPMLALPFFILAGTLMMSGKLGDSLIDFATELVARRPGGLAKTTVVAATVFGGVSGSAVANSTALGSILIPWQVKKGYPPAFCAAVNAASGTIDILIPPSIPMILYALVSTASVADIFIAGFLPGVLLGVGFFVVINIKARQLALPIFTDPIDWPRVRRLFWYALPSLLMPVGIVVLLRGGVATPTEVSVISCVYALAAGTLIYRDMTFKRFWDAMVGAGVATGVVMLVIMGSAIYSWILTYEQVPQKFAEWATTTLGFDFLIILAMNVVMLFAGMFLDAPANILLLGPIFVPLWQAMGLDLVQLGIVMTLNLAVGLYTPPVGTTLFISSAIARVPLAAVVQQLWPFYAVGLGVTLLFSYVPWLTWY